MAIISKIALYERPEQYALSIRRTIDFDDFGGVAGEVFGKIQDFAAQNSILFAGGPFTCYHNTDLKELDVEIGFSVPHPVRGDGKEIAARIIPGQRVVSGISLGPYGETDELMAAMFEWISQNGFEPKGGIYHYYLNDDDRPEGELLTELAVPVK